MALELVQLGKRFGRAYALTGISLTVRPGELLGIVGPDGAGKSTLLRILAGALEATDGTVESAFERKRVGYLSQHFSLYPDMTVMENLNFFGGIYGLHQQALRRRGRYLLEWVGLWEFRTRLAGQLSGGMKQKLSLVCALIHEADLLLLDEPTTAVDPVSRREFWDLILDLVRRGTTVIISTPYMDEAARCHRVAFLHRGQLLTCDTPDGLRSRLRRTVLEVRSPSLSRKALEQAALAIPGAVFAHAFGDSVHVTLSRTLSPGASLPSGPGLEVTRIQPSLEDLFIWMLSREGVAG